LADRVWTFRCNVLLPRALLFIIACCYFVIVARVVLFRRRCARASCVCAV
jgi:hypothetical protein